MGEKLKITQEVFSAAKQRHHNYFTKLVLREAYVHPGDIEQAGFALDRRLEGEVRHYVDTNGIKIIIDP